MAPAAGCPRRRRRHRMGEDSTRLRTGRASAPLRDVRSHGCVPTRGGAAGAPAYSLSVIRSPSCARTSQHSSCEKPGVQALSPFSAGTAGSNSRRYCSCPVRGTAHQSCGSGLKTMSAGIWREEVGVMPRLPWSRRCLLPRLLEGWRSDWPGLPQRNHRYLGAGSWAIAGATRRRWRSWQATSNWEQDRG